MDFIDGGVTAPLGFTAGVAAAGTLVSAGATRPATPTTAPARISPRRETAERIMSPKYSLSEQFGAACAQALPHR